MVEVADIPGVADAGWTPQRHPAPNFKLLLATGATYEAKDPEGLNKWVTLGGPTGCWPVVWVGFSNGSGGGQVGVSVWRVHHGVPYG